jgi:hypothetical protein
MNTTLRLIGTIALAGLSGIAFAAPQAQGTVTSNNDVTQDSGIPGGTGGAVGTGLSTGATVGIVAGVVALAAVVMDNNGDSEGNVGDGGGGTGTGPGTGTGTGGTGTTGTGTN